jgi:hypothetical protein
MAKPPDNLGFRRVREPLPLMARLSARLDRALRAARI